MKFEAFSFSYKAAVRKLFPKLRGRVFHITSPENFLLIVKTGAILNNRDRIFKNNWNVNSYFANKGCVSVCDLVNNTKPRITRQKCLNYYRVFQQDWGATTVFLFLSSAIHDQLITWHAWKKEKAYNQVVPELESGFPDAVPLEQIEEIWFLTITDYLPIE